MNKVVAGPAKVVADIPRGAGIVDSHIGSYVGENNLLQKMVTVKEGSVNGEINS